jgi:hypothetical protein
LCRAVIYGRSDKRYCSSTCRRDASRARTRIIRLGDREIVDSEEWRRDKLEEVVLRKLEREHGPNHKSLREARRTFERLREKDAEELQEDVDKFNAYISNVMNTRPGDWLICAECGREARNDENPDDEWRVYSTGVELIVFCPECAEREFGQTP